MFCELIGGASTHLQLLSDESRKYMHNAIPMSGTALNSWAMSPSNTHVKEAYAMAAKWNQPQQNVTGLVELFKTVSTEQILDFIDTSLKPTLTIIYGPVVESMYSI